MDVTQDGSVIGPTFLPKFVQSIPVDLVYNVIQWAYVKEMGQWYEEDLLISVDL